MKLFNRNKYDNKNDCESISLVLYKETAELVRDALFNESCKYDKYSKEQTMLMSVYSYIDLDLMRLNIMQERKSKC